MADCIGRCDNGVDAKLRDPYGPPASTPNRDAIVKMFGIEGIQNSHDDAKVSLGRELFYENKLSSNNQTSCATCHNLEAGGDDGLAKSIGNDGSQTLRNTPSVYNLDGHVGYKWDGGDLDLGVLIENIIQNPTVMGGDWEEILLVLRQDDQYNLMFRSAYGAQPSKETVRHAISTYLLSLTTLDTRFDAYLTGDENALDDLEKSGLALFVDFGCSSCHQGPLLGANLYQKFGIFNEYPHSEGAAKLFKVPSLRNVQVTGPYFHDGSVAKLEKAVSVMAYHQLGVSTTPEQNRAIVAFLKTLSSDRFSDPSSTSEEEAVP